MEARLEKLEKWAELVGEAKPVTTLASLTAESQSTGEQLEALEKRLKALEVGGGSEGSSSGGGWWAFAGLLAAGVVAVTAYEVTQARPQRRRKQAP